MKLLCIKQHINSFEAQFMKKWSNTETELKISVAYKKKACKSFACVYNTPGQTKGQETFFERMKSLGDYFEAYDNYYEILSASLNYFFYQNKNQSKSE